VPARRSARRGRHRNLARSALEDRDAELLFELFHRDGERRLADEARVGGAAEMPLSGDGDDVAQSVSVMTGMIRVSIRRSRDRRNGLISAAAGSDSRDAPVYGELRLLIVSERRRIEDELASGEGRP